MLFFWGGLDGFIKPEHVKMVTDGMRAANKPFSSVEFFDADHGFSATNAPATIPTPRLRRGRGRSPT